jgi:hypothetical protein
LAYPLHSLGCALIPAAIQRLHSKGYWHTSVIGTKYTIIAICGMKYINVYSLSALEALFG